jgi:hypothetical protein
MSGYYSILQYMPDPERREAVNFGVMLLEKETGQFSWILTRPIRRIQRFFPGTSEAYLNDLMTAFYNRICAEQVNDLDDLTHFAITRGGVVQCSEPQWVDFAHKDMPKVLQRLLEDLVF